MKILHVLDVSWPIQRGYAIRSYYITKYQKSNGLEPIVLTSESQYDHNIETYHEGIKYYRTNIKKALFSKTIFIREILKILRLKKRICKIVQSEKVDLIHAHSPFLWGIAAIWAGKKLNKKVIYEVRAIWEDAAVDAGKYREGCLMYQISRRLENLVIKKAHRIVVICEGLREEFVNNRHISGDKIVVVPNGVDTKEFRPLKKSQRLMEEYRLKGKIVCGFIGSMFNFEGLELLVEAAMNVKKICDNLCVILAGEGEKYDYIKKMVESRNLKNIIFLIGKVPHSEIKEYYSVIDIFVYPRISKRITELVTPLKPLEAMAMGKTVLVSDVGGLRELIEDKKNGFLFKAGNVEDLSKKIYKLCQSSDKILLAGKRARHRMITQRNWEDLIKIYKNRVYI